MRIFSATAALALAIVVLPMAGIAANLIDNSASRTRGAGVQPNVILSESNLIAGMLDDKSRFMMLSYRMQEGGGLSAPFKVISTPTVHHDMTKTLLGTLVSATLHLDTEFGHKGALTLDAFELDETDVTHLDRHRALPTAEGGAGGFGKTESAGVTGDSRGTTTGTLTTREGGTTSQLGAAGGLTTGDQPGLYAQEVAIADVSVWLPEGGLQQERVATAIIDEDGELQIDTWNIGAGKEISHAATNTQAGEASHLSVTRWSKGIVTGVIDSADVSRFIVWEITQDGSIIRRETVTAYEAYDLDIAPFESLESEDRYVAAIRKKNNTTEVLVFEISAGGMAQNLIAQRINDPASSRKATKVSVSRAARTEDGAAAANTFYTSSRDLLGKHYLTKWVMNGNTISPVFDHQTNLGVSDLAIGLHPYAPTAHEGADTFATVVKKTDDNIQIDLWSSYFQKVVVADDLKDPGDGKGPAGTLSLIFSKNSPTNERFGFDFPTDMPAPRMPAGFDGCSADDITVVRTAWVFGHLFVWRAQQVMQWLRNNPEHRAAAWEDSYSHHIGTAPNGFNNFAPRGWFGRFDSGRFEKAWKAIDKLWNERMLGKTFTVKCRVNDDNEGAHPCYSNVDPTANHIGFGTINFCDNFFAENRLWRDRGRIVVHEILHWMKIPDSAYWVTDTHDYWEACGLFNYHVATQLYGDLAAYIANNQGCNERNYERAVRNNDNYAYFAREIGSRIYDDNVDYFPSLTFWQ